MLSASLNKTFPLPVPRLLSIFVCYRLRGADGYGDWDWDRTVRSCVSRVATARTQTQLGPDQGLHECAEPETAAHQELATAWALAS